MAVKNLIYISSKERTEQEAQKYLLTHCAPHRYLAYRDIPALIKKFVKGKKALDHGAGTGASSAFLQEIGLEVTGTDISSKMLEQAQINFPDISFFHINNLSKLCEFDLVFSSFVLFELSSKNDIFSYLKKTSDFLKDQGIFIGITGSEQLHSIFRKWFSFDTKFKENHKLISGSLVKLALKSPPMEFYDYYWKESDYIECLKKANFEIIQICHPVGLPNDIYPWEDELSYAPFTIFVAKKTLAKL